MATIAVTQSTQAGVAPPTFVAAAAGGDQFSNNGKTYYEVKNGSGAPITVTFARAKSCDQGGLHPTTVSVPATTGDRICGPFDPTLYNDANQMIQVTYSAVTSLTVAAVSL
jgi:2-methylaconitate cis-trans-isomerase PrpF